MVDESLLPPPEAPARPFPWRAAALILVPAAALAAGTGVSWLGGGAGGDALLRWLQGSSLIGLLFGAACGAMFRKRRLLWAFHGAVSPWLVAALVLSGVRVSDPLREALADRDEALLGPPGQSLCKDGSWTRRWTYAGPFRPDTMAPRARLLCSIVTDAGGIRLRSSVIAVADPE